MKDKALAMAIRMLRRVSDSDLNRFQGTLDAIEFFILEKGSGGLLEKNIH